MPLLRRTPLFFYVKVRVPGHKRTYLLAGGCGGELVHLRFRAARFKLRETADRVCEEIARENPGYTAAPLPVYVAP